MARIAEAEQAIDNLFRAVKSNVDFILASELSPRGGVSVGTQSIQTLLNRQYEVFIDGARQIIGAAAAINMDQITSQMIASGSSDVSDSMRQFALAAKTRVNRKQGLARVHEMVANEARERVLKRYDEQIRGDNQYRQNAGRLSGRLRKAISRRDVIRAGRDGIIFGNTAVLDATAAHWRRINFGAGERGAERPQQPAPLILGGQRLGGQFLRFDTGPSPAFSMPAGLFFNGGVPQKFSIPKGHQFYPLGQALARLKDVDPKRLQQLGGAGFLGGRIPTKGIRGAHFMEAGLFVLGRRLPDEYFKLAKQWIAESLDDVRPRGPIAAARAI